MKPGYKQTEVGVIPEDWEVKPFLKVLTRINAKAHQLPASEYQETGDYSVVDQGKKQVAGFSDSGSNRFRCPADGVIVFGDHTCITKFVEFDFLVGADGTQILRTKDNQVARFVAYDLEISAIPQTGYNRHFKFLKQRLFVCPPVSEQRAIAAALSEVDALLAALDRLIAKKRDLKQAAMQQLLTGQTRLPGFEGEWVVKPLMQVSTLKGRIGWQGLKQTEFTWTADHPFLITGMNFKEGAIRWDEVYHISEERYEIAKDIQLRMGDVLMTKDGTIGKVLYVDHIPFPGKASLNSHLLLFRPVEWSYDPKFLYFQLNSKRFKDFIELNKSGTTFFGISQSAVERYEVLLPSLAEQTAIATVLSDMDAELAALEQRREKTRALKQGMMQELLTGRTRLI